MARINIEDSLWSDPRFLKLCIKIGNEMQAIGAVVLAWRLAQRYYCPDRQPIPVDAFERAEMPEALIETGLAERVDDGVRMCGSDEHFAWWFQRQEAGRKGGLAKAKRPLADAKREVGGSKQNVPSSSYSFSNSKKEKEKKEENKVAVATTAPNPVGVYITAYKEKYGHRPEVGPKEGKILKTFAENHPARWQELIIGYLEMPDSWAVQRSHPVEVLIGKVNEIGRYLATGKVVTKKVIQHAEELIDKAQGTDRAPRRDLDAIAREHEEMLREAGEQIRIGGRK